MITWDFDKEPEDMHDRGDLYRAISDGKVVAKFSDKGGWGRGIQIYSKKTKNLEYSNKVVDFIMVNGKRVYLTVPLIKKEIELELSELGIK